MRLKRLEDLYRGFFYWFALKSKAGEEPVLPPRRRLVAVLMPAKKDAFENEFEKDGKLLGAVPFTSEGFLARRENLLVLSERRFDTTYDTLKNSSGLLAKGPADAQVKEILIKALDDESELAAVTHDGSRQLLAASGLVPRSVAAPEWIQFGMASFFETPPGAPWINLGGLHVSVLEELNYLAQLPRTNGGKKLDLDKEQATTILRELITDQSFRKARTSGDRAALLKARTMSWALTYFLAHKKLPELRRYFKELSSLPRDLDFDDDILVGCFVRAFDLADPAQPNKLDNKRLAGLAEQGIEYLQLTPLQGENALQELKALRGAKP